MLGILAHTLQDGAAPVESSAWWIGWTLSTITAITFLAIGIRLAIGLRGQQALRYNPLALATAAIFLSCGGGHLLHSIQLWVPYWSDAAFGAAARIHYLDWHLWVGDGLTALAGVLYWTQRRRFPSLVAGAAMYEDLRTRTRDALEVNDTTVQALNAARLALQVNQPDLAREELASVTEDA